MIRIAAVGDLHFGAESGGGYAPHIESLPDHADLILLAGDLTRLGTVEEARVAAGELQAAGIPIVAVLGNHDYHSDKVPKIRDTLEAAGTVVLEGSSVRLDIGGLTVGIAGAKGFGGGFVGACASDFGEPEMKSFIRHTEETAAQLEESLRSIHDADVRIALLHYAPIDATLRGERPEIYPFLGSFLLGESIDRVGCDLVVHGHAHRGTERGLTPGGISVRNVAQSVIGAAYSVYCLTPGGEQTVPAAV